MIKIGITQRVDVFGDHREKRDSLDQQWSILLDSLGILPIPIPNHLSDPDLFLKSIDINGFILSGGNDLYTVPGAVNPSFERDLIERKVMDYALKKKLPLLGVCRGLQMINVYFGGKLVHVDDHVATKHQLTLINGTPLSVHSDGIPEVNSYHNFGLYESELGKGLQKMAVADDNTIEALFHQTLPWIGIMWHPERQQVFNATDIKLIQSLFHLV